jgi:hypothetical protein
MDTMNATSCAPQRSKNRQKKLVVTVFAVVISEKIENNMKIEEMQLML